MDMGDLISRQAAIDALAKHEKSRGHNYTLFVDIVSECEEIIRDLPSAQPKISCDGCRYKGRPTTNMPCCGCIRKESDDYYEPEE